MKVTGQPRPDGHKDYEIRHRGNVFLARRVNSTQFECHGYRGTLKAIKRAVENGAILATPGGSRADEEMPPESGIPPECRQTWQCIDPCALLVFATCPAIRDWDKETLNTLDCFGWLDENGRPDFDRAHREFNNHRIRKGKE